MPFMARGVFSRPPVPRWGCHGLSCFVSNTPPPKIKGQVLVAVVGCCLVTEESRAPPLSTRGGGDNDNPAQ